MYAKERWQRERTGILQLLLAAPSAFGKFGGFFFLFLSCPLKKNKKKQFLYPSRHGPILKNCQHPLSAAIIAV